MSWKSCVIGDNERVLSWRSCAVLEVFGILKRHGHSWCVHEFIRTNVRIVKTHVVASVHACVCHACRCTSECVCTCSPSLECSDCSGQAHPAPLLAAERVGEARPLPLQVATAVTTGAQQQEQAT